MKAIVVREFGGPEVLQLAEIPTPAPGPGQVVVKIKAAGVNPADTYMRSGTYAVKPPLPYTPGGDGAGTIESIGSGVTGWNAGDRVYLAGSVTGTYAEYALATAAQIYRLPGRVTFAQGAGIHVPYATAYYSLYEVAHARPGENVLVHGASGGVGVAAVQIARAAGMRVIGTASSEKGRELAKREGAHEALDHKDPKHFDRVMELTGNKGADVIVEMLANVNLGNDLKILAQHGRVAVIGNRGEVRNQRARLDGAHGNHRRDDSLGSFSRKTSQHPRRAYRRNGKWITPPNRRRRNSAGRSRSRSQRSHRARRRCTRKNRPDSIKITEARKQRCHPEPLQR